MYRVKWCLLVIITTIAIALVLLSIDVNLIFGLIYPENIIVRIFLLIIINITLLSIVFNIPLYIRLNDESITVKKIFGKIQIKYSDIVFAKNFNPAADSRLLGSGGFGGFIGKFSNNDYGWYTSYVLNNKQTFLISVKNNRKYAFSCENSKEIIDKINKRITNDFYL
jgi:hypothetical protein